MMRLDPLQKRSLMAAIKGVDGKVYLFGSRVDAHRKGGDIDILIFTTQDAYRLSKEVRYKFTMQCDEKIDIVIMNPKALTEFQSAFLVTIVKERLK